MKVLYKRINQEEERTKLDWTLRFENIMEEIDIDFSLYNVDNLGISLYRIFIYPNIGVETFSHEQESAIKRSLEKAFKFKNKPLPENVSKYEIDKYMWEKSVRKVGGICIWTRCTQNPFSKKDGHQLILVIENADLGKCTLKKREVVKTVYEMDCSGKE